MVSDDERDGLRELAEALWLHNVCDAEVSSISVEVARGVWAIVREPQFGESDWRDSYFDHASAIIARLALIQKQDAERADGESPW